MNRGDLKIHRGLQQELQDYGLDMVLTDARYKKKNKTKQNKHGY